MSERELLEARGVPRPTMSDHASLFLAHRDYHGGVVRMSADTYATLVRERDEACEDRDRWKTRAERAEAIVQKLSDYGSELDDDWDPAGHRILDIIVGQDAE